MWLLIVLAVLLVLGPTRRVLIANWRTCLPMMAGAVAGWTLGKFVFGSYPMFSHWVPAAWAVIAGFLSAKTFRTWWG